MPLPFLLAGLGALVSGAGAAAATVGSVAAAAGTAAAAAGTAAAGAAAAAGTAVAAAGTAVAGAATAAGTAAAGAAAAASTAVAGAAATASTAVAGAASAASAAVSTAGTMVAGAAAKSAAGDVIVQLAVSGAVASASKGLIDNVFREKVSSPAKGSVLYCDLVGGLAEHSGIYIGDDLIVHLGGDGCIEIVDPKEFMGRLDGWNNAISIYVSCAGENPVGSEEAAQRAISKVGDSRAYSLLFDNCHQFTAGCLTGSFDNPCNFLTFLKDLSKKKLGANTWRVWDIA